MLTFLALLVVPLILVFVLLAFLVVILVLIALVLEGPLDEVDRRISFWSWRGDDTDCQSGNSEDRELHGDLK